MPYGIKTKHFERGLENLQRAINKGENVSVIVCNKSLLSCFRNPDNSYLKCLACVSRRKSGLNLIEGEFNVVSLPHLVSKERVEINRFLESDIPDIESLKNMLTKMSKLEVFIDIKEVRKPEVDAQLVADNIASQLEKRISFRRAMKKAVQSSMRLGAKGVKVVCSGRLGGAEIARTEKYAEGSVPLHTLRSDIDYATSEAETTYGICGIKVWINKGEILNKDPYGSEKKQVEQGSIR